MRSRPKPQPINYKRPLPAGLSSDPQVKKWLYRLKANPGDRPRRLSEAQLAWVHREVMRDRPEFSQVEGDLYLKAMSETCPILSAPELERDKLAEDMEVMLTQPEMRAFWDSWDGERSKSGPAPDYWGAKALMSVMGMGGISAHVDDNHAELSQNSDLLDVFKRLEGRGDLNLPSYQHLCKQLPRVANQSLVMAANVEMIKSLAELHPGRGIGERLLIDGMGFPAWCRQLGVGKTKGQEQYRRRNCPHAGARAVKRNGRGKRDVTSKDSAKSFMVGGDFWRGYYLVAIADQATGLPLVWLVQDANLDEAAAIVPLLSRLYRLWPEIPAKVIAGDSAWDEKEWCRLCEQDYGIHPIFRWHDERGAMIDVDGFSRTERVVARTNKGEMICADHREILDFKGAETPSRDGLKNGKTHPSKGEFRVRGTCKHGCGSLSLRMIADWRRLTYYPHFNHGGPAPERYAYRQAMLTRLNGIEGIWERLQVGRHVGNQGANRTRVREIGAHETIVSLALLSMTASCLADQRRQAGITPPPLGSNDDGSGSGSGVAPEPATVNGNGSLDSNGTGGAAPEPVAVNGNGSSGANEVSGVHSPAPVSLNSDEASAPVASNGNGSQDANGTLNGNGSQSANGSDDTPPASVTRDQITSAIRPAEPLITDVYQQLFVT